MTDPTHTGEHADRRIAERRKGLEGSLRGGKDFYWQHANESIVGTNRRRPDSNRRRAPQPPPKLEDETTAFPRAAAPGSLALDTAPKPPPNTNPPGPVKPPLPPNNREYAAPIRHTGKRGCPCEACNDPDSDYDDDPSSLDTTPAPVKCFRCGHAFHEQAICKMTACLDEQGMQDICGCQGYAIIPAAASVPVQPPQENIVNATGQQDVLTPLTYEQEIHALLYAGKRLGEDLSRYLVAQAKQEHSDAQRLTIKAVEWVRADVARFDAAIPKALARRDAIQARQFPEAIVTFLHHLPRCGETPNSVTDSLAGKPWLATKDKWRDCTCGLAAFANRTAPAREGK